MSAMSTHYARTLDRALDNLESRRNRGQEFNVAFDCVLSLYGVTEDDLRAAYDELCGVPEKA